MLVRLVVVLVIATACLAQIVPASFSATHYGVLSASAVKPNAAATNNVGLILLNANFTDNTIQYALATNATNITAINVHFRTSDDVNGQLLIGNLSRPANGYIATTGYYSGIISVADLEAALPNGEQIVSALQIYVEVHTLAVGGAALRANMLNVAGKQTHTAVLTGSQATPPVNTPDGGIAIFFVQGTNVYWTAVWTSVTQIANGTNIYGPANVGSSSPLAQRWITAAGDTYNSDFVNGLSTSSSTPFSKPNFDASQLYVLVLTIANPAPVAGHIRGQINPVTIVTDATPAPTSNPSGGAQSLVALTYVIALLSALALMF